MEPKYIALADTLRQEIQKGTYPPACQLPTEQRLSSLYGVSRQTVRLALGLLREEGLIHSRQGSGTFVSSQLLHPSAPAAVLLPYTDYIYPTLQQEIHDTLSALHIPSRFYYTNNLVSRERELLLQLEKTPLCGLIVEGVKSALPNPNLDLYQGLLNRGVPVVFLKNSYPELTGGVSVLEDNFGGGYLLARRLMNRGCRRIAGIFSGDDRTGLERYHGCLTALRDASYPMADSQFFWYRSEYRQELLRLGEESPLSRFVLELPRKADGLICQNDEVAYYVTTLLISAGAAIPQDLSVVSFDNSVYSELSPTKLTSLACEKEPVGQMAARTLSGLLFYHDAQSCQLPWTLKVKASG
jgi:GntR family transcriptional regulator of arabinose operon